MLRKGKFFIIGILMFHIGCKQDVKLNNCVTVNCRPPFIELRLKFVDKQNLNDLLFGLNKRYTIKDVSIYSARLKKELNFKVDSVDVKNISIVFLSNSSDEFTISFAKKNADVLKVETKYTKDDCCGTLQLSSLVSNNLNSFLTNRNSNLIIIKI